MLRTVVPSWLTPQVSQDVSVFSDALCGTLEPPFQGVFSRTVHSSLTAFVLTDLKLWAICVVYRLAHQVYAILAVIFNFAQVFYVPILSFLLLFGVNQVFYYFSLQPR